MEQLSLTTTTKTTLLVGHRHYTTVDLGPSISGATSAISMLISSANHTYIVFFELRESIFSRDVSFENSTNSGVSLFFLSCHGTRLLNFTSKFAGKYFAGRTFMSLKASYCSPSHRKLHMEFKFTSSTPQMSIAQFSRILQ